MAKTEDQWADVEDIECIRSTGKAIVCRMIGVDRGEHDIFSVPRSLINEDDTEVLEMGDIGTLVLATWKALELKLI